MNVLIADREARVRSALRLLLEQMPDAGAIEEVCDAQSLLDRLGHAPADLLLLDWTLASCKTADLMPELRRLAPGIKVIALSVPDEDRGCAIASGVNSFVSKSSPPDELIALLSGLSAQQIPHTEFYPGPASGPAKELEYEHQH